jgi:F0F1-type ATP synthase epsilon subunit
LGCGRLTVADGEGGRERIAIRGGFLQVSSNAVTVLTSEAAVPDEIDAAKVNEELRELKSTSPKETEREAHEQRQAWAQARLRLLTSESNVGHN